MRKLRAQMGPRVETGAIQIGDDWPGIFIRGDDAFRYSLALEAALVDKTDDVIQEALARNLIGLLRSCDERLIRDC